MDGFTGHEWRGGGVAAGVENFGRGLIGLLGTLLYSRAGLSLSFCRDRDARPVQRVHSRGGKCWEEGGRAVRSVCSLTVLVPCPNLRQLGHASA